MTNAVKGLRGVVAGQTAISEVYATEGTVEFEGQDVTKLMFQYGPVDLDRGTSALDITVRKKGSSDARKGSVPVTVQK